MPFPLVAAIGAGASLLGGLFNSQSQSNANRQQLQWQEKMYDKQRADSLSDWNMTNEYNSPTQQMLRLKQAGLNPHLVYGNGATTTAAKMEASSAPFASLKAPQIDPNGAIGAFTSLESNAATVDNLRENVKSQQADQALKDAQRLKTLAEVPGAEAASAVAQGIQAHQIKAAELANENTIANTAKTLSDTEVNKLTADSNIKKNAADIIRSRIQSWNDTRSTTQSIDESKERVRSASQGTLESAYRIGQIIRTQDLTDQQLLTEKERTEAERLQNLYNRGIINRNFFERVLGGIIDAATKRVISGKN